MIDVNTKIPDDLFKQLESIATEQKTSMDKLIADALTAKVSAWEAKNYLEERAKKGSWEKFQSVLAKVSDREPDGHDRL
jgi:hypothetical protein